MIFDSIYMDIGTVCSVVALIYMIVFAPIQLHKRLRLSIVLLRGLFFVSIAGAIMYKLSSGIGAEPNFELFRSWRRISEFGYKAVWSELARNAVPFAICGFLLTLGFNKADRLLHATIIGIVLGILLGAARYLFGSFDIDEVFGAVLGMVVGYSVLSVVIWMLPKVRAFDAIKMSVLTHILGVVIILATYFACVGALVIDSGMQYVKLQLPPTERALPVDLTISAQVDDVERSIMTYQTIAADPMTDVALVAKYFGMKAEPVALDARAQVTEGTKSVIASPTGDWIYTDNAEDKMTQDIPSDAQCIEIAKNYATNGLVPNFEVGEIVLDTLKERDDSGNEKITEKLVYMTAKFGGREIKGASEIVVSIGSGGQVMSVEKHNANFKEYKAVKTISAVAAIEKLKSEPVYHTLYDEAPSADIQNAYIGYWLEEVKGVLQPVWIFKGKAALVSGETRPFEIVIPAMK